jgi:hypothetical protein
VQYCDAEVYAILMRSAAETLQTFAHKLWDADLGIVSVLHTWARPYSCTRMCIASSPAAH